MVAHSLAPLLKHSLLGHHCSSAAASAPPPLLLPGDHLAAVLLLQARADTQRVHRRDPQGHLARDQTAEAQAQGWGVAGPGAWSSSQLRAAHVASAATRQLLRLSPGWSARHCSPAPHLHAALLRRGRQQPLPLPPRLGEVRLFPLPTTQTPGLPRGLLPPAAAFNSAGLAATEGEDVTEGTEDAEEEMGAGVEAEQDESTTENGVVEEEWAPRGETDYEITRVPGDGRCLFSAVLFGLCHVTGTPLPSSYAQHCHLADVLRNKAADEFTKRREETEWFLEGKFESYVANMRRPHVWGGEPELLMLSHVLKHPITVFIRDLRDRQDGSVIIPIAEYGREYAVAGEAKPGAGAPSGPGEESEDSEEEEGAYTEKAPICVLYNGYNHYDSLQIGA